MSGNLKAEMDIRLTGRKHSYLNPVQKEPCGHVHDTRCDAMNPAERALKHSLPPEVKIKPGLRHGAPGVPTTPSPPQLLPGRYLSWSYSCERCMWLF